MRTLFWDIETSLQPVTVFQLAKNDWIDPSAILEERYIICASWMWEGDSTVHAVSVLDDPERYAKNPHDDRHVVEVLHNLLTQADVLVHHNGDKFDRRYVETRNLAHGLPPLPAVPTIDTYKLAKRHFLFNSNKLNYIGQFLGVGKKLATTPHLWMDVYRGKSDAITAMVRYNKQDVRLLHRVYHKLKAYGQLPSQAGCPRCGSVALQSRGVARTRTRTYQRFQCQLCRGWSRALRAEASPRTAQAL
jgi:hypothetical protein